MAFSKASLYGKHERSTALIAKAIAHPTRLYILDQLAIGPTDFAKILEDHPIAQPTLSRHLNVLRSAGLIKGQSIGMSSVYELLCDNHPSWLVLLLKNMKANRYYHQAA